MRLGVLLWCERSPSKDAKTAAFAGVAVLSSLGGCREKSVRSSKSFATNRALLCHPRKRCASLTTLRTLSNWGHKRFYFL